MELKRPRQTGTTSRTGDRLQHEAALNVQARIDAEARRRRQRERAQFLRFLTRGLLVLVLVGGGAWAWRMGWFDKYLGEDEVAGRDAAATGASQRVATAGGEDHASAPDGDGTAAGTAAEEGEVGILRAAEAKFAGATLGYWKNAVAEDRPVKGRPPLVFTGLVPDGKGDRMLFELTHVWGKPLTARRLAEGGGAQILSKAEFEKLVGAMPYLVVREGRAYFCSNAKERTVYPVPRRGTSFNPSRNEYGALFDLLPKLKVQPPTGGYEVVLLLDKFKKDLPIATVRFGEEIPRSVFERAARTLADDAGVCETILSHGKVRVYPVK